MAFSLLPAPAMRTSGCQSVLRGTLSPPPKQLWFLSPASYWGFGKIFSEERLLFIFKALKTTAESHHLGSTPTFFEVGSGQEGFRLQG